MANGSLIFFLRHTDFMGIFGNMFQFECWLQRGLVLDFKSSLVKRYFGMSG